MKKVLAVVLVGFALAAALFAQAAPKKVLDQKTLDRFLADYPKIQAEGERTGIDLGEDEESAASADPQAAFDPAALRAQFDKARKDPKAKAFLAKFGWNDSFWDVTLVVSFSTMVVGWEQAPAEYRSPQYDDMAKKFKAAVHPADLALVRSNFPRIAEALDFGSMGDE